MIGNGEVMMRGVLGMKVIRPRYAPLVWRIKNALRLSFIRSWIGVKWIAPLARAFGLMTAWGELSITIIKRNGLRINYGIVSRRVITDAGVAYMVDDWDGGVNVIDNFNYHGCGTGTAAEVVGDTALGVECTTVLNPDSVRATGTKSQPTANQLRSIGTLTFDGAAAVTEHGLFTQAATGGGTLWDRSVFSAINVGPGDSIQFTYTGTLNSGG